MPRPRKERPFCPVCKVNKIKLLRHKTCSPSCGHKLKWENFWKDVKAGKKVADWNKAICAAGRTAYAKRLKTEMQVEAEKLGITFTKSIGRLYIRARNRGYHNGYYTCLQRWRAERAKRNAGITRGE